MPEVILLDSQYLPPVQTFTKFLIYEKIFIDDQQIFQKQTFRNRTVIQGANNELPLIIPLCKGKTKLSDGEVRISYRENWQHQHWRSIETAYGKSPFFIHYADRLSAFYTTPYERLFDLNLALINTLTDLIGIPGEAGRWSDCLMKEDYRDFRGVIHPKKRYAGEDREFKPYPYIQTFSERFGFRENLCILDLLFNAGPGSREILQRSVQRDQSL